MINKKYDIIILMESNFQYSIIEFMKQNLFIGKKCLVIDARPKRFIINGKDYHFNVSRSGGNKNALLTSFIRSSRIPNMETVNLLVPYPTSNFFVLEKHIKYQHLSIFDDGSGTLMGLAFPGFFQKRLYMKIRWHIKKIFYRLWRLKLRTDLDFLRHAEKYYTVYKDVIISDQLNMEVVPLKYFDQFSYKLAPAEIGFIGYPDEDSIMQKIQAPFEEFIRSLFYEHKKKIIYFPHPRESLLHLCNISDYIDIVKAEGTIEEYLKSNYVPEKMIALSSSVLLNLHAVKVPGLQLFYCDLYKSSNYRELKMLYNLFEKLGISEWTQYQENRKC